MEKVAKQNLVALRPKVISSLLCMYPRFFLLRFFVLVFVFVPQSHQPTMGGASDCCYK